MDLGLAGRVVLISGGHRGTGAGTARIFAGEGARVAVHGFEPGQADEVVSAIRQSGGEAVAVDGSLSTGDDAAEVVNRVESLLGGVDVLINNYGAPVSSTWDTPADAWAAGWDVNVLTAIRLTQAVLPAMKTKCWGRIVFLSTVGTGRPGERNADYYGAKTALHTIARSLAKELRGTGITANVVSPGLIATAEVRETITRRAGRAGVVGDWPTLATWAADNMLANLTGRVAEPEDIGRIVAFVASEVGWHLNGADIRADGGALDATPTGL